MREALNAVYAVTSEGRDWFSAMTRVSVASLRINEPRVAITMVCDAISGRALQRSRDPLLNEVDTFVICDTPNGDAGYRNRHVKTRLRNVLEGRLLFLDSDTFVRGGLSSVFDLDSDVAGVPNHSSDKFSTQAWEASEKEVMTPH